MEQLLKPKYNFEDIFPLHVDDVQRLTPTEAYHLRIGDIALVRSVNVPELGNHFIVVTGHPVKKPHGVRPQVVSIAAREAILSEFDLTPEETTYLLSGALWAIYTTQVNGSFTDEELVNEMYGEPAELN